MESQPEFTVYESHRTPLDDVQASLDKAGRWPLRLLLLALASPIIIAMGNHVEFVWPWSVLSEPQLLRGSHAWLAFLPFAAAVLIFASRFPGRPCARGLLCALSGMIVLGPMVYYTHWLVAVVILGAIFVAVGNRVGKEFSFSWAPRIVAATGGVALLTLYFWPLNGEMPVKLFFTSKSWQRGGWLATVPGLTVFIFAAAGALQATPLRSRLPLSGLVSALSRTTLLWIPFAMLFGGGMIARSLGAGLFDQTGITTSTVAFKFFGISYPILIVTALGLASLLTGWLWSKNDSEPVEPPELPDAPSEVPEPPVLEVH